MRSAFICTTLVIFVSLVFSQRPLARYPENLKRAVPHHYKNDKENTHRGLDKIPRWHKIEPPLPRLQPHQTVPWLRWVHEGRWAAQADKNTELHKVRAHLLEEKLKPNHLVFKPHINPQLKPKLKGGNVRTKREVGKFEKETQQKEIGLELNVRHKRDLIMPQLVPEMILQPHIQAKIPQPPEQIKERVDGSEKRKKRHVLYFINRPSRLLARSPRTTPNPFIRDTHIEEYDIIRPEVGEREGMIPTIESGSSDLGSYPLVTVQKILSDLTKNILILGNLIAVRSEEVNLQGFTRQVSQVGNELREKRSPKMSKLKKKQKIEKKKRKKKKQKELSPRRIKHIRRKKEKKERRKRLHDKKLKEKRRLRHKKLGTGPYNKTITDYYGIYYDPPSVQLNESLYDSIYDTSEIDSDALYEERMKERYDDYQESESEDSDAYYDEQIYGDTTESEDERNGDNDDRESRSSVGSEEKIIARTDDINKNNKSYDKQHETIKKTMPPHLSKRNRTDSNDTKGNKKKE